jgi:hypothetical protein
MIRDEWPPTSGPSRRTRASRSATTRSCGAACAASPCRCWARGEQDGIVSVEYGQAYADSFPNGHFVPVPDAGHFPHLEQLGRTLGAIGAFVDTVVKPPVTD